MHTPLIRSCLVLGLLGSSPAWACANDMAGGGTDWVDVAMISATLVMGGGLSLLFLAGLVGLPVFLLLRKRRADDALQQAAGIGSDGDGPPDVWVPGS